MKISEMNWLQVEEYLKSDDRAVVPLGCTEQHAYLSLSVDSILAERVASEAAAPTGVPVFPGSGLRHHALFHGLSRHDLAQVPIPICASSPTSSIRLKRTGFRRILFVNGHGGNTPGQTAAIEWMGRNPECRVKFHNWWNAPRTFEKVKEIDPVASHASWMENFPWTRLPGIEQPSHQKPMVDLERMRTFGPEGVREILQEGNFGGYFQRSDEDMNAIWSVAIDETRALIENW